MVPAADLDAAVDRWLENLLACAPLSLRAIKQIVRRTAHMTAAEARMANLPALIEVLNSEDGEEGVQAFTEKRAPGLEGPLGLGLPVVIAGLRCGRVRGSKTVLPVRPPPCAGPTSDFDELNICTIVKALRRTGRIQ